MRSKADKTDSLIELMAPKTENIKKKLQKQKPSSSEETARMIVREGSMGGGEKWNYGGKDLWNR